MRLYLPNIEFYMSYRCRIKYEIKFLKEISKWWLTRTHIISSNSNKNTLSKEINDFMF